MARKQHSWLAKFQNAFRGVAVGIRGQNSFWVHIPVAIGVIVFSLIVGVPLAELSILFLCIGVVIGAELFNGSLEHLSRAITVEQDEDIRNALDIASGAVLILSITAAIIGVMILANFGLAFL